MAQRAAYKVFVSNLPWTIGRRELKDYFSQFGYVNSSHVIFDSETGMSKGFGFIVFGNKEAFVNATKQTTHQLEHSTINVQPSDTSFGRNESF
ncbi:SRA stem-loop-interacting RNA-binding protein, mitochondrial-like [Centruroides vittatus]|uniref:SRA stem-loop-interacting RNA-binding protein, mitochondrial-like n=1 Tax=Centruroides vittatus TaxID=120091 RepID=UPI00350F117E